MSDREKVDILNRARVLVDLIDEKYDTLQIGQFRNLDSLLEEAFKILTRRRK